MSNHTTQRTINLHHKQVDEGRERAEVRCATRLNYFLSARESIREFVNTERQAMNFIEFCAFVSIAFITVSYLSWLV